jgi:hypothetical protein
MEMMILSSGSEDVSDWCRVMAGSGEHECGRWHRFNRVGDAVGIGGRAWQHRCIDMRVKWPGHM